MSSGRFGAVFVLALATEASASPLRIEWQAPGECPQSVDVREGVERLLGAELETADLPASEFSGSVEFVEGVWRLDLSMVDGEETNTRSLTGQSCHEVTEAGIVVLALALNPEIDVEPVAGPEPSEPEPLPDPEPVAPAAPAEPARPSNVTPPRPTPPALPVDAGSAAPPQEDAGRHRFGLRLAAVFDAQTLPGPTAGAELGLALPRERLTLEAHGLYLSRQRREVGVARSAEIGLYAGGLGLCYQFFTAVDTQACLRAEAGILAGKGLSATGVSGSGRWLAGGAGVMAAWPSSGLIAMVAGADAWVPFVRDEFVLGNDLVHRVPAYALRGFLGAEARFR